MQLRVIAATILLTLSSPYLVFHSSGKVLVLAQTATPTNEERITEAITLNNNGEALVYIDFVGLNELQAGLELFQQALAIFKKSVQRQEKAIVLSISAMCTFGKENILRHWSFFRQL